MFVRQLEALPLWKKIIVIGVSLVAIAGLFDGLSNMPVVSGCAFYGECPHDLPPDPPNER